MIVALRRQTDAAQSHDKSTTSNTTSNTTSSEESE
jgi:hypothetical protein